ncbi:hypothetical protein [Rhodococcus sp. BP22]|uniref:hypothetical protein n=1 Tax=Rhodococcus sp. BP22 TaxID=2758566 RepID=UPI0028F70F8F|nr:hypothetical protein [Rhodococcus sp. BP22]
MRSIGVAAAVGLVGIVSACSSAEDTTAASDTTSVASTTVAPTTTTTTRPVVVAPEPAQAPPAVVTPEAVAVPVLMPPVVCMNLQAAQNLIQDAGVFFSRSEDASGAGRMQVNDSNWIVVDQTPAVGMPIEEGDAVLSVVKLSEPNNC